jgi:hypothetical protein
MGGKGTAGLLESSRRPASLLPCALRRESRLAGHACSWKGNPRVQHQDGARRRLCQQRLSAVCRALRDRLLAQIRWQVDHLVALQPCQLGCGFYTFGTAAMAVDQPKASASLPR